VAKFVHPKGLSLNSSFQRAYHPHFAPGVVHDGSPVAKLVIPDCLRLNSSS
jgi:hypothetical protein